MREITLKVIIKNPKIEETLKDVPVDMMFGLVAYSDLQGIKFEILSDTSEKKQEGRKP